MSITRYRFEQYEPRMYRDSEGDWIEYKVYKELEEKFEKMRELIESNDLVEQLYEILQ